MSRQHSTTNQTTRTSRTTRITLAALAALAAGGAPAPARADVVIDVDGRVRQVEPDWARDLDPEADVVDVAETAVIEPPAVLAAPGDRDDDFVPDGLDTCPDVANPSNYDADADGLGNACDADYDGSGTVTAADFAVFLATFGAAQGDPGYDSRADHDGSGTVTVADYGVFLRYFGASVAPRTTGPVALESARVGDQLLIEVRYGAAGLVGRTLGAIDTVVRDAAGRVQILYAATGWLTVLRSGVWMVQHQDVLYGNYSVLSCARMAVLPHRPWRGVVQGCTPNEISAINVHVVR